VKQAANRSPRKAKAVVDALQIDGDMTIYQAEELKQKLLTTLAASGASLTVDLQNVGEIDSAGIQLLIAAKHAAAAIGKSLVLTARSQAVTEVLELFGLVGFFAEPLPAAA
jgi:anti-anti-sigma factor